MHKKLSAGVLAVAGLVCASTISGAATLDDVMARLNSLQRDNAAMRKEISALRQKEQRSVAAQAADTRDAPSRQMPPSAASAMAADYPVKGRYVSPPQAFSWSGFYAGLHAGYGWGKNDWTYRDIIEVPGLTSAAGTNAQTNGILGGIQAGANYQSGMWVFGIESEFAVLDGRNTSGSTVVGAGTGVTVTQLTNTQIDWLATFAGRFGIAFDRSLFYVKGGIAAAEYKDTYNWTVSPPVPAFIDSAPKTDTRVGWSIGAGWEYAFAANWSAKVEYNYMDFGSERQTFSLGTATPTLTVQQDIEHKLQVVKAGLNYRF